MYIFHYVAVPDENITDTFHSHVYMLVKILVFTFNSYNATTCDKTWSCFPNEFHRPFQVIVYAAVSYLESSFITFIITFIANNMLSNQATCR